MILRFYPFPHPSGSSTNVAIPLVRMMIKHEPAYDFIYASKHHIKDNRIAARRWLVPLDDRLHRLVVNISGTIFNSVGPISQFLLRLS